jgi:hypothetical protein
MSCPECPAQFHCNKVAFWDDAGFLWAEDQTLPPAVPHDKEIIAWLDRPTQPRVRADVLRFGIVLNETRQHEIWVPSIGPCWRIALNQRDLRSADHAERRRIVACGWYSPDRRAEGGLESQ